MNAPSRLLLITTEVCPHCGTQHNEYPFRTCRSCRVTHVIDINALDQNADVQFDYDREREEQRITPLQQKWENG